MSPDLTRSLHDAVDTGPDDSPFDVATLTGRIRRRRTVRAGVRGGVAVGAVGAVAFGAVYVGGRQPPVRAPRGPGRRRARDVRVGHRAAARWPTPVVSVCCRRRTAPGTRRTLPPSPSRAPTWEPCSGAS